VTRATSRLLMTAGLVVMIIIIAIITFTR